MRGWLLNLYAISYDADHRANDGSASLHQNIVAETQRVGAKEVLEVGCATGQLMVALARVVDMVTGIDVSRGMVKRARRKCGAYQNVDIAVGDILNLQSNRAFDLVVCSSCLQFMADPQTCLEVVHRSLRPGGRILITLPHRKSLRNLSRRIAEAPGLVSLGTRLAVFCGWLARGLSFWTKEELCERLKKAGFIEPCVEAENDWGFLASASC